MDSKKVTRPYLPSLSANPGLPWTKELVSAHPEVWNWTELSRNPSLPWSEAFLERYRERWDWKTLSANGGLPWSRNLLTRYSNEWNWWKIAGNEGIPWDESLFERVWNKVSSQDTVYGIPGYEGLGFGTNRVVPWNMEKSERLTSQCWCARTKVLFRLPLYSPNSHSRDQEYFNFILMAKQGPLSERQRLFNLYIPEYVCWELNPALSWSSELLSFVNPNPSCGPGWAGMSANRGIPWSAALLSQFRDRFFPDHQSVLVENDQVWHRAFAPAVTESVLRRLLREA